MKAVVSQKGQITIPKPIRNRLGIVAGTVLEIESVEGRLVAVKREAHDPLQKWRGKGKVPGGVSVDEYLKRVRG